MYQIFKDCDFKILWSVSSELHRLFLLLYWVQFGNYQFKFILPVKIRSVQNKRFVVVSSTICSTEAARKRRGASSPHCHTATFEVKYSYWWIAHSNSKLS